MPTFGERPLGNLSTPEYFFETLKAESECLKTYLEYFDLIDNKRPCELAAQCFTEDAEIAYYMKGSPLIFQGRSQWEAF